LLLDSLSDGYAHDSGTLLFILDEMLRRGLISVTAATKWVTSPLLKIKILNDPWLFSVVENIIDRTIDFVKAAVGHRKELSGIMIMDEFMDLIPPETTIPILSLEKEDNQAKIIQVDELEVDYNEDDDEEDDNRNSKRRTRQRRDDGSYVDSASLIKSSAVQVEMIDEELDDPVLVSTESVRRAIRSSREVFTLLCQSFIGSLTDKDNQIDLVSKFRSENFPEDEAKVEVDKYNDLWLAISSSLVKRTLSAFADAEKNLSFQHQQRIVLSGNVIRKICDERDASPSLVRIVEELF
jgi:hypothetical protein